MLNVRLDDKELKKFKAVCAIVGGNMSEQIRLMIDRWVNEQVVNLQSRGVDIDALLDMRT